MPTGYTAKLVDKGQSFEEFVWTCARAFGGLMHMRYESLDTPITPEPEGTNYGTEMLAENQRELERLGGLTRAECDREAAAEYAQEVDRWQQMKAAAEEKGVRIHAMIMRVTDWQPPTKEHEGLRRFMLNQLIESERYDGWAPEQPKKIDGYTWVQKKLEYLARSISASSETAIKTEHARRSRKEWVDALARAVPLPKGVRRD